MIEDESKPKKATVDPELTKISNAYFPEGWGGTYRTSEDDLDDLQKEFDELVKHSESMRRELLMGIAMGLRLAERCQVPARPSIRMVDRVNSLMRGLYGKYSKPTDVLR